jgi:septum formation protein
MHSSPDFILASASPRRRELLQQIGCQFQVAPADIDETVFAEEAPSDYVERMALQKAKAGWKANKNLPVLGADTAVVLGEREGNKEGSSEKSAAQIFGKPADESDAISMLMQLSGTTHSVLSAVAMVQGDNQHVLLSETFVTFRPLDKSECHRYWLTGEPCDKAGAYAIQGLGGIFVENLRGSYSGVVGLPLVETCSLLEKFGIPWWSLSTIEDKP